MKVSLLIFIFLKQLSALNVLSNDLTIFLLINVYERSNSVSCRGEKNNLLKLSLSDGTTLFIGTKG